MAGDAAAYFGRALAAARAERGIKRMQLKDLSGLSYPYIAEIENGGKYPSQRAIQKLATALEMSPSELVLRAEQIASDDVVQEHSSGARYILADAPSPPSPRRATNPVPLFDADDELNDDADDLVARITDQVLRAIDGPLRAMIAREVEITVREELLRQRGRR